MLAVINLQQIKKLSSHKTPLLRKASKTFFKTALILLMLSTISLFFFTRELLQNEVEEELFSNKDRVERLLREDQTIKGIPPIMMVEKVKEAEKISLKDTLIFDPLQDEVELFEQLSQTTRIKGQYYRITVRAMVIESEDILLIIVLTFLAILILAFIFLFYINRSRNEKLWKPFFTNLYRLKNFSLKSDKELIFEDSDILEFYELQVEMQLLTTKIQTDYKILKQFTEDVSHEMQTPLAIMQAKIDNFINTTEINEIQFQQISSLQTDISRLKQLNKKLILLAKIDNDQFSSIEEIKLSTIIKEVVANFRELTSEDIKTVIKNDLYVSMDRSLAIILCNNLISNAIKYNKDYVTIEVTLSENILSISNNGDKALQNPDKIFERYYKEGNRSDSTGLGLSIIKKICDYYGFKPTYHFSELNISTGSSQKVKHVFEIDFKIE